MRQRPTPQTSGARVYRTCARVVWGVGPVAASFFTAMAEPDRKRGRILQECSVASGEGATIENMQSHRCSPPSKRLANYAHCMLEGVGRLALEVDLTVERGDRYTRTQVGPCEDADLIHQQQMEIK